MNSTSRNQDYVIGLTRSDPVETNPKARQSATIESLVHRELLSIWQDDGLDVEAVLDKIEMMEHVGWEHMLRWLGHFCLWDSSRDEWHMTPEDQEAYELENARVFVKPKIRYGK